MTQVHVRQLVVPDERAVAGGGVDVERGPQRRHDHGVEVGDPPGLDHRHVGQTGQDLGRHPVAGDDHEPPPGPLQVRQPHGDLVRGVVRSGGVDHELRRVRGHGRRHGLTQPPGRQDLASTVEGQESRRDQGQRRRGCPPPRRPAQQRDEPADGHRSQVGGDGGRDQVSGRWVGLDPGQVRDEADTVVRGSPQQWLAGQHGHQEGCSHAGGKTRGALRLWWGEGRRHADDQERTGDEDQAELPSRPLRLPAAPDLADRDRDQRDDEQHEPRQPVSQHQRADADRRRDDGRQVGDQLTDHLPVRLDLLGVSHRSVGSSRSELGSRPALGPARV